MDFDERLSGKVEVGDCWLWTGALKESGYGNVSYVDDSGRQRWTQAHRWTLMNLVGPIPEGSHVDHLCRVRSCVNPDHLEVVTPKVNAERGAKAVKRWCVNGHDLNDPTVCVVRPNGTRKCKVCHRDRMRASRRQLEKR